MRLWLRLAAAMAVVSILPLLLATILATRTAASKAERSSAELLQRDATAIATFVDTWMQDQGQAVSGWMQLYPLEAQSEAQRQGLLRAVHRAVPSVVSVVLVDADGQPLQPAVFLDREPEPDDPLAARTLGSPSRSAELVRRLPISEALAAPGVPAVGSPYRPPTSAVPVVPIAAVGRYGEGIVLGAEIELTVLSEVVRARSSGARGVALLDPSGAPFLGGTHPLIDPSPVHGLLGNAATVGYVTRNLPVRGALSPIGELGWSALVAEPSAIASRGADEIRQRSLEFMLAAVVLALITAFLLARTMSEPIADLTTSALAVSEGDLGHTVPVQGQDELAQLAEAFNLMSRRLAANQEEITAQRDEIEAFNRELQARVDERTAQLERAQEELVRSGQLAAVAEIGAGLAHELNNPLSSVLGIAQVLQAKSGDALVAQLVAEAERCRNVVEVMTRLSSPEGAGEADVIDLTEVLHEVLPPVRATARQRGVAVTLDALPEPLRVRVDPALAGRAVVQLIHALSAGLGSGRTLTIGARVADGKVLVSLAPDRPVDEGARRDDFLAAGVSLWVARQLVDRLGGTVRRPVAGEPWVLELPEAA
ncbi:MAG: HAMP domain-containing protein [Deltaproteobacteria bacterium]|nr:MAG: HAMP domain-containing protein [Deltaproteobacteria bacterium]